MSSFLQAGPDANLSRFAGSASISSAEYFGREETTPGTGYNNPNAIHKYINDVFLGSRYAASNLNAPDMEDVKESVRQGVSKVAGRLSNMASGVMTQLQVSIDILLSLLLSLLSYLSIQVRTHMYHPFCSDSHGNNQAEPVI